MRSVAIVRSMTRVAVAATLLLSAGGAAVYEAPAPAATEPQDEPKAAFNPRLLIDARIDGDPFRIRYMEIDSGQLAAAGSLVQSWLRAERANRESSDPEIKGKAAYALLRLEYLSQFMIAVEGARVIDESNRKEMERAKLRLAQYEQDGERKRAESERKQVQRYAALLASSAQGCDLDLLRGKLDVSMGIRIDGPWFAVDLVRNTADPRSRKGGSKKIDVWRYACEQIIRPACGRFSDFCARARSSGGSSPEDLAIPYRKPLYDKLRSATSEDKTGTAGERNALQEIVEKELDRVFDLSDDAEALASAGMGTDEDYGYFGGDD